MRYLSRSFSESYRLADNAQTIQTNKKSLSDFGEVTFLRRIFLFVRKHFD